MVFLASQLSAEEEEIRRILISIICLYGSEGLPLEWVDQEFFKSCGFPIPYQKFGAESLKTWLITLPNVYIVKDLDGNEVLVEYSPKSQHIKDMVLKQRNGHRPPINRKNSECNNLRSYKTKRRLNSKNLPEGSFIHTSINNASTIDMDRYEKFEELESMLPLFYKHQALGDDFFLDIADMKLGYYVPERGPKTCGLCSSGQTITALTEKVRIAAHLAPRVVVMIGFQDLLLCDKDICDIWNRL
ncbi:uncharacterized protein LOC132695581 isoform X2 [Cylas formicarius]|uniref:uncharacterized protein LOC132695581 isoform X2 n=1 Tax=Cylas formicarius TaxID=197179 RepID=UPI0029589E44|nr:uncharacterized protein LOC132695581 isoform X2 [Cylas formicarius]